MVDVSVSIVVPCFNHAHFLNEALQSVLNQTYKNWECIIVNDGSPDNTEEVAINWCEKDNRFKYLYKDNGGLSSARNAGIKISTGKYILALDADDILHKDYILKTLKILQQNPDLAIVSSYRKFFVGNISNVTKTYEASGNTYRDLMFENVLMPSSIYRKACWVEVGGYDESMTKGFEDWEFWISILKRGWKYKFVEEYLFYYRKSKNSMLIDTLKNHRITNMEYVFEKHNEIYLKHFRNTKAYLFFLINFYRNSEIKTKISLEYKIGSYILLPLRIIKRMLK
ncbi:glycosyltransferase family 2 protein [Flaviramulus sp. BrNp1-15]|uniref:glycosyltransferase family 2 protein n=1 Tax=Flaviramulus sp. BrNp1-15 TaxID=2916754 RepID=UPI001EE9339B|nr:glycosyltransferase family A protein [Flaviramulus sp. BrNp1-15]ULC60565.1 glycosyltransferase family 2 protein [Flaviramulus sp. BrNp1-15]